MASISSISSGTYYGVTADFFNNTASSASSGTSIYDFASIKNGSYAKLMRAYYGGNSKISSIVGTPDAPTDATAAKKNATMVKEDSSALKASTDALMDTSSKSSVFNKKTVTKEDGTTSQEYDKDAIYKAVSTFVKDYNAVIESASESDSNGVLTSSSSMVNYTKVNAKLLKEIGITVGSDNKLTIDEKAFKNADMADVKTMMQGSGSYAYNISASASNVYNNSVSQLAQLSGATYTSAGAYNYSASLFNSAT